MIDELFKTNCILNKKYLCKKSLSSVMFDIEKDNFYRIRKIGKEHVMIRSKGDYEAFSIARDHTVSPFYFFDYFYSLKEERKEKINRLKQYD